MLGQRRNKRGIPTSLETFLLDRGFVEEVSRQAESQGPHRQRRQVPRQGRTTGPVSTGLTAVGSFFSTGSELDRESRPVRASGAPSARAIGVRGASRRFHMAVNNFSSGIALYAEAGSNT